MSCRFLLSKCCDDYTSYLPSRKLLSGWKSKSNRVSYWFLQSRLRWIIICIELSQLSPWKILWFYRTKCTIGFLRCWLFLLSFSYRTITSRSWCCKRKMGKMPKRFLLPHWHSLSFLLSDWNILNNWVTWCCNVVYSLHSWLLLRNYRSHCCDWSLWSRLLLPYNINSWPNNIKTRGIQMYSRILLLIRCLHSLTMRSRYISTLRKTICVHWLSKRLLLYCWSVSSGHL